MRDEDKTRSQLIDELVELRMQITELGASESEREGLKESRELKIGEILMEMGFLTRLQLEVSLKKQKAERVSYMLDARRKRLGEVLVETGTITEEQLQDALAEQRRKLGQVREALRD